MSLQLFSQVFQAMLTDFGTMWIATLVLSLGLFFLLLATMRNFPLALIIALTPLLLFAMISQVIQSVVGYAIVIIALIFSIAIVRLFIR